MSLPAERIELPPPGVDQAFCYQRLAVTCRPRDRLTVSQWADRHRVLSTKQAELAGQWRTNRNPILRAIMDAMSRHSPWEEIIIKKSSQIGVTEAVVNFIGYTMEHAPAPVMVFLPSLENRDKWKAQKLNPLFSETPVIRNLLGGRRSRDAANRQDMVDFPGGILFLGGANSPNSYAQVSARDVVMDDLDRFPEEVGSEGDPVDLGRGRLKAFRRHKLMLISTPTIEGASLITREYENSNKSRFQLPCPACGTFQVPVWSNVKWDASVRHVWYECEHCGYEIQEHQRGEMLEQVRLVAERPEHHRLGIHANALVAGEGIGPSWGELARQWVEAQGPGNKAKLQVFVNTHLAEAWRDETSRITPHELLRRFEDVPPRAVPVGCMAFTVGVDTQDKFLALTLLGWGANHLWIADYTEFPGDTTQMDVWDRLEEYLNTPLVNAFGRAIRISGVAVDSRGHRGEEVRKFVERKSLKVRVYSVQGSTIRINRAIAHHASHPDRNARGKAVRGGYGVWNVGTEYCKDYLLGRINADAEFDAESRVIRFCAGLTEEYAYGLLSEYKDPIKKRYLKKKGAKHNRNEPLDTLGYAWAIGHHKEILLGRHRNGHPDPHYWDRLAAVLEAPAVSAPAAAPTRPAAPAAAPRAQPGPDRGFGSEDWNL